MTREELILHDDAVRVSPDGLDIQAHLPWYRSLPLSSVMAIELRIDDAPVDLDAAQLTIDGIRYRFADLADAWDHVWFIQDPATVHVTGVHRAVGESVTVTGSLALRFPYIIIPGVGPLQRTATATRKLVVGKADA